MHEVDEATRPGHHRVKEVKVRIPISYHIKLHSMKVLTGKPISDAVTEALEAYFSTFRDGEPMTLPILDVEDEGRDEPAF